MPIILKRIIQILISAMLMFYAFKLSLLGYPVTGWFLCGALLALSYQFIIVPRELRTEGKIFLSMIGTGALASVLHFAITMIV